MTAKRFVSEDNCCGYYTEIIDNEKELDLSLPNPKKNLTIEELVDLLNEQHKEIEHLKAVIKDVEYQRDYVHQKYDGCRKCVKKLSEKNEQLKKSIECQDETIKEQCIKLDWASECGVKWGKEFKEWNGIE